MIHIYESKTAPAHRRFIAQHAHNDFRFLTIHGPTAEIALAKAQLMTEYQVVPALERKAFDLKGRLTALGGDADEYEDLL